MIALISSQKRGWYKIMRNTVTSLKANYSLKKCIAGICSTVGGAATWAATAAIVESKIEEYKLALKQLIEIGDRVKLNINDFNTEMNDAKAILIEEIRLITDWEVAAEGVNNNIDSFSIEDLKAFVVFQEIFVDGLDNLKKTAEDYLNFSKFSATEDENK